MAKVVQSTGEQCFCDRLITIRDTHLHNTYLIDKH